MLLNRLLTFRLAFFFILFLILGCNEELNLDNPFDPDGSDYVPPETTILNTSLDGSILEVSSVEISWLGNELIIEYSYKFDDGEWSEWSEETSVTLNYLDEGEHVFSVKGRYSPTIEEENPPEISFEVDMMDGPGLRIYKLYQEVTDNDNFLLYLYAEEVSNLVLAEFQVLFDSSVLQFIDCDPGDMMAEPYSFISELTSSGEVTINLSVFENEGLAGSGSLAVIEFKALQEGMSEIEIVNSIFRNIDNNNITISDTADGIVMVSGE